MKRMKRGKEGREGREGREKNLSFGGGHDGMPLCQDVKADARVGLEDDVLMEGAVLGGSPAHQDRLL